MKKYNTVEEVKKDVDLFESEVRKVEEVFEDGGVLCPCCQYVIRGTKKAFTPHLKVIQEKESKSWISPEDLPRHAYCGPCAHDIGIKSGVAFYRVSKTLGVMRAGMKKRAERIISAIERENGIERAVAAFSSLKGRVA